MKPAYVVATLELLLGISVFLSLGPGVAVCFGGGAPVYGWCGREISEFCSHSATMPERLRCLKKHYGTLSRDCQDKVAAAVKQASRVLDGCRQDLKRFCKDRSSGYGPASQCLLEHKKKLSLSCKKHLPEITHYAYKTLVYHACLYTIRTLCYKTPSEAGVISCLKENYDRLNSNCKDAGSQAGLW